MFDVDSFNDAFLSTDDFAVEGVYTPIDGFPVAISGIFDSGFNMINLIGSASVEGYKPTFQVKTSDITGNYTKAAVVINSKTYYIQEKHDDGQGMSTLILSEYP